MRSKESAVSQSGGERNLKFREKLAVVLSNGTGTFHFQVIQMFLLFFYTDIVGISPAYVAGLFLFTRIFDACLSPMFGMFVDKVTTPLGKYKPWVVLTSALLGVFGWMTFTTFNFSPMGKLIYATVTYVLYSIMMAIGSGPLAALTPATTKKIDERISMGQIGFFTIMIGAIIAQIAVQPLYKALGGGNDARGFSMLMGVVAIFSVLIALWQGATIKERYIVEKKKDEKAPAFKDMLKAVMTNKTAMIVYSYVLGINLAQGIRSAVMIHYFKYFFHNEGLVVTVGLVSMVPTMIGVALSSKVTKWIGIKMNLMINVIVSIALSIAIIVIPPSQTGVIVYMVLIVIVGIFAGLSTPAQGTMMPAAIDYTEWKTGMNINAFMGSFQGFLQTFGTALSGAIAAGSLTLIGYVPGGAEQSMGTVNGLRIIISVLPAIATLLTAAILWFDLTESKQVQITKELAERRKMEEEILTN